MFFYTLCLIRPGRQYVVVPNAFYNYIFNILGAERQWSPSPFFCQSRAHCRVPLVYINVFLTSCVDSTLRLSSALTHPQAQRASRRAPWPRQLDDHYHPAIQHHVQVRIRHGVSQPGRDGRISNGHCRIVTGEWNALSKNQLRLIVSFLYRMPSHS